MINIKHLATCSGSKEASSDQISKTQSRYIQTVHTLWVPMLFTIVLTLKFLYKLLVDVFEMYICFHIWPDDGSF